MSEYKVLQKLVEYFGADVRRINHALKVYGFAKLISGFEEMSSDEWYTLMLASILHDIGIKESERKYNSSAGKYQELEGPPIAGDILKSLDIEASIIERVCFLIGNHHSYGKIDKIDFQILVEADFLVNIYEDGMDAAAVHSVKSKYFKTPTGTSLLGGMYITESQ